MLAGGRGANRLLTERVWGDGRDELALQREAGRPFEEGRVEESRDRCMVGGMGKD